MDASANTPTPSGASPPPAPDDFTSRAVDAAVRIGVLVLLAALCLQILTPFLIPLLWGVVIAVAVYPAHRRVEQWLGGRPRLAATLVTLAMLLLLVVPAVILGRMLAQNVGVLLAAGRSGTLSLPPPPPSVESWPLVGPTFAKLWEQASSNIAVALRQLEPQIKVIGSWLLETAAGAGVAILQFIAAVFIAGVLLARGGEGHWVAHAVARRLAGDRGPDFADLAEATVRNVARGVLGVALIQSTLAGIGLVLAGVPAASVWAFIGLILAVVQIGVGPVMLPAVLYVFSTADTLTATLFLVWAIFVTIIDNVLRPLLLGRGIDVPMVVVVVGTLGGMLHSGIIGLFVGPVILALAYKLLQAWLGGDTPAAAPHGAP